MSKSDQPINDSLSEPRRPWFLRSRIRLYAMLVLALAIPGAVLSMLIVFDVDSEMRVQAERENRLVATMVAQSVKEQFEGLKLYVRSYAARIRFSEAVCARDTVFGRFNLEQMLAKGELISRVLLTDTSGVLWLDSPIDPSVMGMNFSHRDWYRGVIRSEDVYVSEMYQRQALGQPSTVAIASRVRDTSGHFCGILVAQVTVNDLARWFLDLQLPNDRSIALIDQNGHWLDNGYSSDSANDLSDTSAFAGFMNGSTATQEMLDPVTRERAIINTIPVMSVGWSVAARRHIADIERPARALQKSILLYFIAGLIGMIVIGGSMYQMMHRYDAARTSAQKDLRRAYAEVEETVRARTEDLIKANRESQRLAAIIESSSDSICSASLNGIMTSWNDAAEHLYGYRHDEIVGQSSRLLIPDERDDEVRDVLNRIAEGHLPPPFETVRRHKAGHLIHVSQVCSPIRDDHGTITGVSVVSRDISQQKRIEEQARLLEQERAELLERLQMTFDRMPIGCILNDTDFRFTYWNPAAEKIFGYRFDEVKGKHPFECITPLPSQPVVRDVFRRLAEGGKDVDAVGENVTRDGGRITCVWHNTSLRDREGRFIGIISMCQDVTEQKKDEERLRVYASALAQNNRELQDFAFVASHDLQEPLRKIAAFGDRLRVSAEGVLDSESKEYLDRMQSAAARMQTLIRDLLDFSRVATRAQPFVRTDLNKLAKEVTSDLETRIEQTQGRVVIGELPTIEADPVQMRQLLQNLIANALKFHRSDFPPVVRVNSIALPVSVESADFEQCRIIVADNGIGFDMKYVERIFTPFQRLHGRHEFEGTGMGLAICRKIVERHHGTITATSIPGEGSTFVITLPIIQPDAGKSLWTQPGSPSASSWPTTTQTIVN